MVTGDNNHLVVHRGFPYNRVMGEIALYTVFHCLPLAVFSSIHEHADTQGLFADLVRIALSREPSLNGSLSRYGKSPIVLEGESEVDQGWITPSHD